MNIRVLFCCALLVVTAAAPLRAETAGAQSMARGEYARAVREMTVAAKAGDPQAQFDLGMAYREGKGVGRDPEQAFRWIRMAADKNLADAQFEVAQMEEEGEGVDANPSDAAEWYRKAAKQGNVGALFALGELYRDGRGVAKDETQAVRWFRQAADQNDVESQLMLGGMYQDGQGVVRNLNDAAVWFRKAAQLGSAQGRYQLALVLLGGNPAKVTGHRPSRDTVEAVQWLEAASEQGYAPAQYSLAMAHINGVVAGFDLPKGLELLQQAADQGHPEALRQLGRLYQQGRLLPGDPVRAYTCLDLAVRLGDTGAVNDREEVGRTLNPAQQQMARKRAQDWMTARGL